MNTTQTFDRTIRAFIAEGTNMELKREERGGLWNGYIIVPPHHPWHGAKTYHIPQLDPARFDFNWPESDWTGLAVGEQSPDEGPREDGKGWVLGFHTIGYLDTLSAWPIERVIAETEAFRKAAEESTYFTGRWIKLGPWFEPKRIPGPFVLANAQGTIPPTVFKKEATGGIPWDFAHSIYFLPPPPVVESNEPNPFD